MQGIVYKNPTTSNERGKVAKACALGLDIKIPIVLDNMENTTEKAHSGWPDRLYLVNTEGKLVFIGSPGPAGFMPAELDSALQRLLTGK
jgi:hypothetical protein